MADSRTGRDFGGGAYPLEPGRLYTVEVDGAYSEWNNSTWGGGTCEGTTLPLPTYPSKDLANGKVGLDLFYEFAAPNGSGFCAEG